LPCVCTRQRTFGLFAVCTRTAKGPRVAQLCSWELLGGVPAWFFAVRGRARPHGKASHGKHCCARQRRAHGKEAGRTAKQRRTAAMATHGKDASHGSVRSARQRWRRTAKGVAVQSVHAHGKGGFAVEDFAVQTMPCVHARQSLCRAYRPLCRPMARTAKPVSPVVMDLPLHLTNLSKHVRNSHLQLVAEYPLSVQVCADAISSGTDEKGSSYGSCHICQCTHGSFARRCPCVQH
jgi:hypothetical protein